MPDAITPTSPTTPNPLAGWEMPAATGTTNEADQNMFLKLLVAQLKYQDVSSPMDPSQMMSQMAQLTAVDKLNALVEGQTAGNASNRLTLAASLVGKNVEWAADGTTKSGIVNQVRLSGNDLMLRVGTVEINASAVLAVGGAATPSSPSAAPA